MAKALKGKIVIDGTLCKECHLCIVACKKGNIIPSDELNISGFHPVAFKDDGQCTGCTLCAVMCPEVAIEVYRE
jgi:2-oxoglutarate ferredoxin oxidoreductase subunit delta